MIYNSPQAVARCTHSTGSSDGVGPELEEDAVYSGWMCQVLKKGEHACVVLLVYGNAAFHNYKSYKKQIASLDPWWWLGWEIALPH